MPSFVAGGDGSLIATEASRLKLILERDKFLPVSFYQTVHPNSYNNVIKAGISEDYSMGYPDEPGFRAGIARPYFFYNVIDDQLTNLRLSFQVMDVTLYDYKKLDPVDSKEIILRL